MDGWSWSYCVYPFCHFKITHFLLCAKLFNRNCHIWVMIVCCYVLKLYFIIPSVVSVVNIILCPVGPKELSLDCDCQWKIRSLLHCCKHIYFCLVNLLYNILLSSGKCWSLKLELHSRQNNWLLLLGYAIFPQV